MPRMPSLTFSNSNRQLVGEGEPLGYSFDQILEHIVHYDAGISREACLFCHNETLHRQIMENRSYFEELNHRRVEGINDTRTTGMVSVTVDESPFVTAAPRGRVGMCYHCGGVITKDKFFLYPLVDRTEKICLRCRKQYFRLCWGCKNLCYRSRVNGYLGKKWCKGCLSRIEIYECCECKNLFDYSETQDTADDQRVCRECANLKYINCFTCHLLWRQDKMVECEAHNAWLCFSHRHDSSCPGASYNRRWDDVFKEGKKCALLNNQRYMGVEIEAEAMPRKNKQGRWLKTSLPNFGLPIDFGIANDGSLRCGKEVNTPPASGIEHVRNVKLACATLKKAGYIILPSCGLHVHIDLRDKKYDFTYLAHLLTTFYAIEDVLYATQPVSRQKNRFCKWLRDAFKFFDFYGKGYITDFDYKFYKLDKERVSISRFTELKSAKYNNSRYYGVNFHSIFYLGTLEIRMHAGSLNPIKIIRWCEIIQKIINWVDTSYKYERVLELLALSVNNKKLDLFSKTFQLTPVLTRYLMTRITQFKNMGLRHRVVLGDLPKVYIDKAQNNPKIRNILDQINENNKNLPSVTESLRESNRTYGYDTPPTPSSLETLTLEAFQNSYISVRNLSRPDFGLPVSRPVSKRAR